jgi:signal peptidase I
VPERLISHEDFGALAGEVLKKGGSFQFQAHGNSMRPFIFNGETIELTAVDPDQLRRGDIVLCWLSKDKLVLHRVIQVQKTGGGRVFLIQGDFSLWPDGLVPGENVLGRATAVLRKGKWAAFHSFSFAFFSRLWLLTIPLRRFAARLARAIKK